MWTPDHDAELRRLGVETYISRHPGADVHEVLDRYLLLLDPEGRAVLLREKNRSIEEGKRTQPAHRRSFPAPWPPELVEELRELHSQRLTIAEIARELGKTKASVTAKSFRLFRRPVSAHR